MENASDNGRKGGKVRAERLTPAERSESARRAAEKRWGRSWVQATHAGTLIVGDMELEVAVLEDGTRGD